MPFDHFGLIAGVYDRAGTFQVSELLSVCLDLSPNCRFLDAGGGTGRVAATMRSMVRNLFVADLSYGMLRYAVRKGLPAVCAPAESLPFAFGSFERIIMVDALHHVIDQRQTARELFRLLAPGGRIVIIEPDIRKPIVKIIAIGEKVLLMRSHILNCEKIAALFTDPDAKVSVLYEGFTIISIVERVRRM
jgi:demethylmenaquinone methyltransferase/2-methoxy-6-polyprenyl-1,4-benzoquinol methylase